MDKTAENLLARKIVAMLWWRQRWSENQYLKYKKYETKPGWDEYVEMCRVRFGYDKQAYEAAYRALCGVWE